MRDTPGAITSAYHFYSLVDELSVDELTSYLHHSLSYELRKPAACLLVNLPHCQLISSLVSELCLDELAVEASDVGD